MPYAESTSVSVEKSQGDIHRMVQKAGAVEFGFMTSDEMAKIAFRLNGRHIRFDLPLPSRQDPKFYWSGNRQRKADQAYKAWEQACRSRWRALFLCLKAKLESLESGIETFDEAFLPHIVMPDGSTVGEQILLNVAIACDSGKPTQLLLSGPTR